MSIQRAAKGRKATRNHAWRVLFRPECCLAHALMLSTCVGSIGGDPLGTSDASIAPGSSSNSDAQGQQGDSRDLLGLTDVSAADSILTPDAVIVYDNEGLFAYSSATCCRLPHSWSAHPVATTPALLAGLVSAGAPTDMTGKATAFLRAFGLRAYRKPVTDAEVQTLARRRRRPPTARRCPRTLAPASTASFARLHGVSSEKRQRYGKTSPFVLMMSGSLHRGHHQ
jgi:hypothetical protein